MPDICKPGTLLQGKNRYVFAITQNLFIYRFDNGKDFMNKGFEFSDIKNFGDEFPIFLRGFFIPVFVWQ
jgi:hypothetical protein